ncbi:Rho GTPase-activating protein 24 isoform X1 [Oopsacas minuta]|uniref:Rho GTPase-activating protein 24 isoform X1 n=1 Tax=Oopsacas minuta TaxID=111878 RepID=A0AAV7K7P1_9METZ|nr:Rho GTPase-activating protein 24 isoform X1 [Oopsacas minuta]
MTNYKEKKSGSTFYGFSHSKQSGMILESGWLYKKGGRISTMKKRWFVLKGDVLHYYSDESESKLLGYIPLDVSTVHRMPPDPKHPKKYRLEITACGGRQILSHNHASFSIYSESESIRDNWYAVLFKVVHAPAGGGIFGAHLHEVVDAELYRDGGGQVPLLVLKSMQFILRYGKDEPGILTRAAPVAYKLELLADKFNEGQNPTIPESENVHTVSALLRKYFKELPEPIISSNSYLECLFGIKYYAKHPETGLEELFKIFSALSYPNLCLLEVLSLFCDELLTQEYSIKNHLTFSKAAQIFGPTIFAPETEDQQLLLAYPDVMDKLLMILIKHKEFFFPSIAQKPISLLEKLDMLLEGYAPEKVGILSAVDFRKKKHTLMQGPPVPPKPYEPSKNNSKKCVSKDDSFKMEDTQTNFKRSETANSRRPPRPPMPNGYLFPENAQGYVEFDLFEDSDEIPDNNVNSSGESKDHVLIPRLPPVPPPKPPKPKKYSTPVNNNSQEEDTKDYTQPITISKFTASKFRANSKSTSDIAEQLKQMEKKQTEWQQKYEKEHDEKEEVYKRLNSIEKALGIGNSCGNKLLTPSSSEEI